MLFAKPLFICIHLDRLPNRDDVDLKLMSQESFSVRRTCLTVEKRTALEELFQWKMILSRNEKTRMATELGGTMLEIMVLEIFYSEFKKSCFFFSYLEAMAITNFILFL